MVNSLITSTIAVAVLILVSAMAGYWFLRHTSWMARVLLGLIVSLWVIPFVIYLLPLFVILSDAGLTDNLAVLGVVYAATNLPFGVFFMFTYLRNGIPSDVFEAAQVDGASTFREFFWIVLPLSRPALATLAALGFVWTWGDLLLSLVMLQTEDNYTLTVAASAFITRTDAGVQELAAAALVAIAPLIVVFLLAQRAIERGFVAGVGK
jgi:ABC-type glycerol-3-phosphate transport system permease component